jgi:GNAT superfamily N-acetyltransferase
MVEVRAVTVEEWATMRAVRLAALTESPQRFGSTTAAEERLDEAEWRRRTRRSALAWDRDDPVGIVAWVWTHEPTQADLVAMWTDPGYRGRGVGAALVSLYRRLGFVETGTRPGARSGEVLRRMRYATPP